MPEFRLRGAPPRDRSTQLYWVRTLRGVTIPGHLGLLIMSIRHYWHDTDYQDFLPLFRRMAEPSLSTAERARIREQLLAGHLPLAEHIALKYQRRGQPIEDLKQVAKLGLIGAVDRFDPERGSDFVAFAVPTIMGELRRYFRDATWTLSVPRRLKELNRAIAGAITELAVHVDRAPRPRQIAAHLGMSLEAVYEGLQAGMAYRAESLDVPASPQQDDSRLAEYGEPDPGIEHVDNRDALYRALSELPERETAIVRMRFFEDLTQSQIAERIGISQVHVSRLIASSVTQLRNAFLAKHA